MKVLIVNKFLYPNGGSETYIFELGKELERLGNEVQYFGMEHEGRIVGNRANVYTENMDFHAGQDRRAKASWNEKIRCKVSGPVRKLSYPFKIIYSADARRKIRAVLEDFRPDVVHLNNINFQITPSIIDEIREFDKNIRIVYTAHDYQWVCPNHMLKKGTDGQLCDAECLKNNYRSCEQNRCIHGSRMRSVLGMMEGQYYATRKTYAKVDRIVCPSHFMEQMLSRNPVLSGRTVTIHNFLTMDKEEAAREAKIPETLLDAGGRKLPGRYALYFGRFDEEKGIRVLMKAIRQLPDIPFVLVGKEADKAYFKFTEEQSGKAPDQIYPVSFLTGDSLKAVIQHADFTIHPAIWYENCPFAVMESETYGTPVVASAIGGIPELAAAGKTGVLVPAGDADALAVAIQSLWKDSDKIAEYRSNCTAWAQEQFPSLEEYTKQILAIYKER